MHDPDDALATRDSAPSPWIANRSFDQGFLLWAWLVPLGLWSLASSSPLGPLTAFFLFIILDKAHICCTWLLSFGDRVTMRQSGRWYLGIFGFFVLFGVATMVCGGIVEAAFVSLQVYWGPYHILRQHYGFLRLYQARGGALAAAQARAEVRFLWAGCLFPLLLNFHYGWLLSTLPHPDVLKLTCPAVVVWVTLAVFIVAAIQVAAYGTRGPRLLHLLFAVSNYWMAFLVAGRSSFLIVWIFLTSYHNLQYVALVWLVGRNRYRPAAARQDSRFSSAFSGSALPFIVLVTAGALMYAASINVTPSTNDWFQAHPQLASFLYMFMSANFLAHQAFDARLWKLSTDHRLRADLALGQGAPRWSTEVIPKSNPGEGATSHGI